MSVPKRWACLLLAAALAGCQTFRSNTWLDPSKTLQSPPAGKQPISPILTTVSPVDTSTEVLPNASPPTEEDLAVMEKDYVIGPTDVLDIGVLDLYLEGQETPLRREVSETGFIRLPLIKDPVKAAGLTKEQLIAEISRQYSPHILLNPTISITVVVRHAVTFSILGPVAAPGTYNLLRPDTRLLDALAMCGDVRDSGAQYLYVVRQTQPPLVIPAATSAAATAPSPATAAPPPTVPSGSQPAELPAEGEAAQRERALQEFQQALQAVPPASKPAEPLSPVFLLSLTETSPMGSTSEPPAREEPKKLKWVYNSKDKEWVQVPAEKPVAEGPSTTSVAQEPPSVEAPAAGLPAEAAAASQPETLEAQSAPAEEAAAHGPQTSPAPQGPAEPEIVVRQPKGEDPFGWRKAAKMEMARVIAIPLRKLKGGEARLNIVIRDKDVILVPATEVGRFYVDGEVVRPGVYDLTGQKLTVKQALSAAGGLAPLAWPKNAFVVRRIADSQEQFIPLDVEAILRGEESDIYVKPDDYIAVGSNISAPWLAVVRNAFRLTYGFGFIWDRNFASPVPGGIDSKRFTRW